MNQQELANLLVKIAGLVIIVYAIIGLPQNVVIVIGMLSFNSSTGVPTLGQALAMPDFWGMSFGPFALYLIAGLFLFHWSGTIARYFAIPEVETGLRASADYRALEQTAVAVLGVYLCAEGLADVARWAGAEFADAVRNHHSFGLYIWSAQFGWIVGAAIRVIIGALLMACSRSFVAVRRLVSERSPGT